MGDLNPTKLCCTTDDIGSRRYFQPRVSCTMDCMTTDSSAPSQALTSVPGDLGWQLGIILRGYQLRLEAAMEGMPEGFRGFQVLSTVVHRDPPNQQALSAHLSIDRTVLTYLLDTLVEAGLVERVPAPSDRRSRKIIATPQGEQMLQNYEQRVKTTESELLAGLPAASAEHFGTLVAQLAMHIHTSDPASDPCSAIDNLS